MFDFAHMLGPKSIIELSSRGHIFKSNACLSYRLMAEETMDHANIAQRINSKSKRQQSFMLSRKKHEEK